MKAKVLRWLAPLLIFAVAISIAAGVSRAEYNEPMPQVPETPQAPAAKGAPAVSKKEEAAYKIVYAAHNGSPATQIQLGEDFVKKYPQSHYLGGVYSQLTTAYYGEGEEDKMFQAGNKALELNPDNVTVLALFAMALPRRVKSTTPDAAQIFQKAEGYARHAIELIPNLPKPEGLDDAAFEKAKNDELSMAHSGLGLIAYQHQKFEEARTELMTAIQLASSPDPVDYFLLGGADVQTSYYNDAIAAYGKCAESGPLVAQCTSGAEVAKKDAATKLGR